MVAVIHKNLTGADAVHPAAYIQSSDPGAVGAGKFWVDTTGSAPYQLKKRNSGDTGWDLVGGVYVDPTTTRGDLPVRGASAIGRLAVGATQTILTSNGTDPSWSATPTISGELAAADLKASGLTGATAASRYVGATASGAPTTGTFAVGDTVVDQTGKIWICTGAGTPGTWVQSGSVVSGGTNGQTLTIASLTELTTIAAAATTTTTIQIPANAIVLAVSVRVTVAIPTAATFTVIGNTSTTAFNTAAVGVAANSTDPGTAAGAFYNASAQTVRITPSATPAANTGRVRVTIFYLLSTPPTS